MDHSSLQSKSGFKTGDRGTHRVRKEICEPLLGANALRWHLRHSVLFLRIGFRTEIRPIQLTIASEFSNGFGKRRFSM
jgi:hypothetical protein